MSQEPAVEAVLEAERNAPPAPEVIRARIAQRLHAANPTLGGPPRRARVIAAAFACAAAIAAVAVAILMLRSPESHGGNVVAHQLVSVDLAGRGVAVADPGAALSWMADAAATRVEQRQGFVFYRVEPGGTFVVGTDVVRATARGTSFSVEVEPSASVRVDVYEGAVELSTASGHLTLGPGRSARTVADSVPREFSQRGATSDWVAAVRTYARATGRDGQNAGVAESEGPSPDATAASDGPPDLEQMAAECHLRVDIPPFDADGTPTMFDAAALEELEISSEENAEFQRAYGELNRAVMDEARRLYVDATGDEDTAALLSFEALGIEIRRKSRPEDVVDARQKLAEERAGLRASPQDPSEGSPIERYFRLLTNAGDRAESLLADTVGQQRAAAARKRHGGWPLQSSDRGCSPRRTLLFPL